MKCFGVMILQLDAISLNTVLQAMKQVVRPNIQFIDSLSLYSPITINELFYRGNQYAMLEENIVVATK